jgi:hypothetical protein
MKTAKASLQWKDLGSERLLLQLWQMDGKEEYPQVCILRVSNSEYVKFSQDPKGFMKFVNDQHVFSKPVILAGPWVSLSSVDPDDRQPDWVLTMVHGKMSTMIVAAVPQLKMQKAERV